MVHAVSMLTRLGWVALAIPFISPSLSLAQTSSGDGSRVWPAPVRIVDHVEPLSEQADTVGYQGPVPLNALRSPLQPHHVIRAPGRRPATTHPRVAGERHPPHHSFHRRIQPPSAMLPEANLRATWKSPYSYGYFGASGTRHWSMHHGYRDRYTEWRLK